MIWATKCIRIKQTKYSLFPWQVDINFDWQFPWRSMYSVPEDIVCISEERKKKMLEEARKWQMSHEQNFVGEGEKVGGDCDANTGAGA